MATLRQRHDAAPRRRPVFRAPVSTIEPVVERKPVNLRKTARDGVQSSMPDDMMVNRTPDVDHIRPRPRAGHVTDRALSAADSTRAPSAAYVLDRYLQITGGA